MGSDRDLGGLWRSPDFRNLWGAVVVSTYGSLVRGTAIVFTAIFLLDASPADIGALRIAEILPGFLVGLVAGAWVDRVRRKPIMVATDLLRAILLATIPLAAAIGWLGLGQLFAVAALVSVLGVFFDVAYQSYLPTLVRNDELVEANSTLSAAISVVEAAAFSSGGWLVQLLSAPIAVLIDAVSFVASAGFVSRIRFSEAQPTVNEAASVAAIARDAADGLREVWGQPILRGLAIAGGAQNLAFGLIGTAILLYLNQEVGFDPGILGMIFAVGGISSFIGAIAVSRLSRLGVGMVMVASLFLAALGEAFVPLAATVDVVAALLLVGQQIVADFALTVYDVNQISLRQAISPAHLLGRVNASIRVIEFGAVLVGTATASYLGETMGLRATLWIAVACSIIAAVALALSPVRSIARMPITPLVVAA